MTNQSITFTMDGTEIDRIKRALKEKADWMAKAGLEPDSRWYQHMVDALDNAKSAVLSLEYK